MSAFEFYNLNLEIQLSFSSVYGYYETYVLQWHGIGQTFSSNPGFTPPVYIVAAGGASGRWPHRRGAWSDCDADP